MMNARSAYDWLVNHSREIAHLDSLRALLSWDQRTYIPSKGHEHRAAQFANLAGLIHAEMTNPRVNEALAEVEGSNLVQEPLSVEAVNTREWRRSYDRSVKIPQKLAIELAKASAEGESAWVEYKRMSDWESFHPFLERLVSLTREKAGILATGREPYDALLDDYERGEEAENLTVVFSSLREALVTLLNRIVDSHVLPDTTIVRRHFPLAAQEALARGVVERLGYDFKGGRMDPTAHPFCVGIGPGDVRITTRYDEQNFGMAFFGAVHEAGHAMYDQGLPIEHWGTPVGEAVSLGIHESQSRMWENFVGRSFGFWKPVYPEAQRYFPHLRGISIEAFHFAVNEVRPSMIRTEADEVTYNLHVLLRFELELALIRVEMETRDLPDAWNEKMKTFLGLSPANHAEGVMQDIHWSGGAIGYFPTYTLGNLYAAQFVAQAQKELGDLEMLLARGQYAVLLDWLRQKIHAHGARYSPHELVRMSTGEDLNPKYLIEYLESKFGRLYKL